MKMLITGGSGFLGINLVRYLLSKGVSVRVLDVAIFDYPEADKVEAIIGDVRDAETARKACQGIDVIVHTAAALPLCTPEEIQSTEVGGTKTMLEAAKEVGVPRFVHISSTAVYGIPDHHPLTEDDELDGVGPYGNAKVEAEGLCKKYRDEGLCVSVIRPKSFIGPERLGVFAILYDWAKDGRHFPMIGNGKNRYQLLDVEDLCEAIWLSCTLPDEKVNTVFNIGAKEFATMREDYQSVLDRAGFGKKIIGTPAGLIILGLRFLELLHVSPIYKWVYETAAKDSFVSIERAEKMLGWHPKFSNQDSLVRNYDWYVEHLAEFSKEKGGVTHRVPWKQGAIGLIKKLF